MTYTSLYRRYRPATFNALVGQGHISRTLINAVNNHSFVHAYLFAGPRGTGKTSTAKILARTVNCLDVRSGEPCGICLACQRSLAGESMDIIEIDAASNRGIDEIRDLRERVKYAPAQEKYKVYIIDEVHMLTGEAFNALLKTLEEPPQHVLFILATTEPHKIPLTVLSRCQRFDFRRISYEDIFTHLKSIATNELIDADEGALMLIARKADGGLRDAVNLLDQCRGLCGERIKVETVNSILGLVDEAFIDALAGDILCGRLEQVLMGTEQIINSGLDLRQVIFDLLDNLRQALLAKVGGKVISSEAISQVSSVRILQVIQILGEAESRLKYSLQPKITLELALIQACGVSEEIKTKEVNVPKETHFSNKRVGQPKVNPLSRTMEKVREEKVEIEQSKIVEPEEKPEQKSESIKPQASFPPPDAEINNFGNLNIERLRSVWPKVLEAVTKSDKNGTMAFLCWGKPCELKGNKLVLEFPPDFELHMKALCNKLIHKNLVEEKLSELTGIKMIIAGQIGEAETINAAEAVQEQLEF